MIDAHCHLQDFEKIEKEIEGLEKVICCGYELESSQKAVEIAEKFPQVFATVGIHPDENSKFEIRNSKQILKSKLLNLSKHSKVVAIGECGLDYVLETREEEKREQKELLKFNLELARETKLPMVIHCRNAFDDIFEMIDYGHVQMHCFTGNMDQMQECVRRGWYMSFGGIVTFKASNDLREVVKQTPNDKLLIETDSPYISPEPVRGKPNSPANLIYIAKLIAQLRSISIDTLDKLTTANTYSLFPKLKLPSL